MSDPNESVEIFCSYAHEDESWLQEVEKYLSLLQRLHLVSTWHDRHIVPGTNWANVIDVEHLNNGWCVSNICLMY